MKRLGKNTFRALRHRNYKLFFIGQTISRVGMWMQRTAVIWIIYTITHSTFMLGVTVFAEQFPSFLFSILGGIVSDRYDRFKIMFITQTASMIQATLLAILMFSHHYAVWQILALSTVLGIINAFDVPARQPLVHQMVTDKEDIPNALALNSSLTNLALLFGPALSGIVLEAFGAGVCFLINAVSFIAIIFSMLLMKLPPYQPPAQKKKIASDMADGFKYITHTRSIGMVLLLLTLMSLFVLPYNTLLPVYAKVIFKGNAATYGYINSIIGCGAVAGTFIIASLRKGAMLKKTLLTSILILGTCIIIFSHTAYFPLAMLFAALIGFGTISQFTISNIIIQMESEENMRGRVMSFIAMALFGMMPLGSMLVGTISQHIGAPNTLLCQGILALIIAASFFKFLREAELTKKERQQLPTIEQESLEEISDHQ